MAFTYAIKLLVVLTIIDMCYSNPMNNVVRIWNEIETEAPMTRKKKSPQCKDPNLAECINCTIDVNPTFEHVKKWYFNSTALACWPLSFPIGQNMSDAIDDLPKTKGECEELCGINCIVKYGNGDTKDGVCMFNYFCDIPMPQFGPEHYIIWPNSNPCKPKMHCCPWNYEKTTPRPASMNSTTTSIPINNELCDNESTDNTNGMCN